MRKEILVKHQLNFDAFYNMEIKHGVFIFVNDVCQICEDYKKEIADIETNSLYFVECILQKEKDAIYELTGHIGMPQTAIFKRNKLDSVYLGMLFEDQLNPIYKIMKELDQSKIDDIEIIKNSCSPLIAIVPKNYSNDQIYQIKMSGIKQRKLLIFNDLHDFTVKDQAKAFENIIDVYPLLVFDLFDSNDYDEGDIYLIKRSRLNNNLINTTYKEFICQN